MKNKSIIISVLLLVVIVVGAIVVGVNTQKVGEFDLNDYTDMVEEFPSDKVLGPVTSAKDAKEKAETVWLEIFGEEVKEEKSYGVSYDIDTGTWLVQGHLPIYMVGGTAHILIRESDGAVLAVWHYK